MKTRLLILCLCVCLEGCAHEYVLLTSAEAYAWDVLSVRDDGSGRPLPPFVRIQKP